MTNFTSKNKSANTIIAERMAEINSNRSKHGLLPFRESVFEPEQQIKKSHLSPERRLQPDFFIVDLFDYTLKDDLASMEHPLFALKAGDTRTRQYEHNGNSVTVSPNVVGCATIHDKDVWIYCISSLISAQNKGDPISRTLHFTAYDFLKATNRTTSGRDYLRLKETFNRLAGTRIITDIRTGGRREFRNFGLLDDVFIILENQEDDTSPMIAVEVTLPDWLFRSIQSGQIKTISPDYFRIRKPLDRRIYELCAKHCGGQPEWLISLELLHKKSGSTAPLRNFRIAVRSLVSSNELPDYFLVFDDKKDILKVKNRNLKALVKKMKK